MTGQPCDGAHLVPQYRHAVVPLCTALLVEVKGDVVHVVAAGAGVAVKV